MSHTSNTPFPTRKSLKYYLTLGGFGGGIVNGEGGTGVTGEGGTLVTVPGLVDPDGGPGVLVGLLISGSFN